MTPLCVRAGLKPEMLVSLTAPKRGARSFRGPFHYLGGRFVPPTIKVPAESKLPPGTAWSHYHYLTLCMAGTTAHTSQCIR